MMSMNTTIATTPTIERISKEIISIQVWKDELSFNNGLYETFVKIASWVLNMSPSKIDMWSLLHIRLLTGEDLSKASEWMEEILHSEKYDMEKEYMDMIHILANNESDLQKIRSFSELEKAHVISGMIDAIVFGEKKGA